MAPFGDRRVVVRTLDAGADKQHLADLGPEENPALGRRGLRLSAERPELLDAQPEALSIAAKETGADVRVMAPMVATAEEAAWFARRVRENGLPKGGVMIEVPAAALRSAHVLAEVEFGSIGTNDLAYTMAADRMQGELFHLLDPCSRRCSTPRPPVRVLPARVGRWGCAASQQVTRCSLSRAHGSRGVKPVDGPEQGAGRAAGAVAAQPARVPGHRRGSPRGGHGAEALEATCASWPVTS